MNKYSYHYFGSFYRDGQRYTVEGVSELDAPVLSADGYLLLKQEIVGHFVEDKNPPQVDEISVESLTFLGARNLTFEAAPSNAVLN